MTSQNLFYITTSAAIIIISILIIVLVIIAIVIALRFAKFARGLSRASTRMEEFFKTLKDKLKYSAIMALMAEGLKEAVGLIKEKRGGDSKRKRKK
ncbi:hypothetical protein MYX06_03685 [Patescibacteria group bacterium AH-259-L05]|nr:hypothetical protein [Patescibacteria group bacterium AH-259-L05]